MAENFVVSARKYRPVTFDTVVGQSHITTTLRNAIRTNHLAQAFLFCGPRGVGKTTTARILAKTINCQDLSPEVEPCGKCESCTSFQSNASFNIHELDAASNNSVEDIRNLIDQVRYPPQTGKYKIYIIDEVHMLTQAAFNAFLKTLEEPPNYVIFILATTEKHKILPTILSRCQIFDFNRIKPRDMADHLANIAQKENITAEYEALELIAQKADGGLRDALSMFDLNVTFSEDNTLRYAEVIENLHILDYDYYFKLTDLLLDSKLAQSLVVFNEILQKGFDGHLFVVGLLEHFRNLLVCQDAITVQLLEVSDSVKNKYLEQSARASAPFLMSALSVGSQCDLNYKASKNQRLHVELCIMKLANLSNVLDLGTPPASNVVVAEPQAKYQTQTVSVQVSPPPTPAAVSKLRPTVDMSLTPPSFGNNPQKPAVLSEAPLDAPNVQVFENKEVSEDEIHRAWAALSRKRSAEGSSMSEQVMLNREITVNGLNIMLTIDNLAQEGILNDVRGEWLTFLRVQIQNRNLQLTHQIVVQDSRRNPYTPQERFRTLSEKNPALIELQRVLGLEVDY